MKFRALFLLAAGRLPGGIRQRILRWTLGYDVHPQAKIGLCLVAAGHLSMGKDTSIGTFTVCKGLANLILEEGARIGRLNWITGLPTGDSTFFQHLPDRDPSLVMRRHSRITHRHLVDCTDRVTIGAFSGFGGFHSTVLTHTIDIGENRQSAAPVEIGDYSFVATNCVILSGSVVPAQSAIAAGSVFRGKPAESGLYSGVPAKRVADLPTDSPYFSRQHSQFL